MAFQPYDRDSGGSVYYPSCVVNAEIRFDEGLQVLSPGPQDPSSVASASSSIAPTAQTTANPLFSSKANDNLTQKICLTPLTCHVELPGLIQAGTFDMEFLWQDFPLDPRVVRAMAVSIHMDAVQDFDFANGLTQSFDTSKQNSKRDSICTPTLQNLVLYGVVDDHSTDWNKSGHIVKFTGRDLRGLFLDAKLSAQTLAQLQAQLSNPIDQYVSFLINAMFPQGSPAKPILTVAQASQWPNGVVPVVFPLSGSTRNAKSANGQKVNATLPGDSAKMSFWDAIIKGCTFVGAVPAFLGNQLIIAPATTIYDVRQQMQTLNSTQNPAVTYPFENQSPRQVKAPLVTKSETFTYRRMVFGRNIDQLKFERKLGGVKVPQVVVTSVDTSKKGVNKVITVTSPPLGGKGTASQQQLTTSVAPGGAAQQTDQIFVRWSGVADKTQLQGIADSIYNQIGRQELGGSCNTKNLASFGGGNTDPDLLRMRPGDPVEFRIESGDLSSYPPVISELNNSRQMLDAKTLVQNLVAKWGESSRPLAQVLVATSLGSIVGLDSTFRTQNVKFDWDVHSGVAISFDFQNYVEARYSPGGSGSSTVGQTQGGGSLSRQATS